jgi:predicted nucleotidyltransferase
MFKTEMNSLNNATGRLRRLMGDNLLAVMAFGSRVRGDFGGDSDFDVLVVVKKRTFKTIDTINGVFYDEEEKAAVPFSVVIKAESSFNKEKKYNTSFYKNLKKEGLVLYGTP